MSTPYPCILCGTPTDHGRQPTYEDRQTGKRFTITSEAVWMCDGCTYDAANSRGRYVDERIGRVVPSPIASDNVAGPGESIELISDAHGSFHVIPRKKGDA